MRFMNMFAKGILASMLVASFATVAVQAESDVKVTGTTDKDEYTGDEEITETVTVDNGSDVALTDITFTGDIPEGYKAVIEDGNATEEGWSASAETIEAGANRGVTVKFVKESAEVNPSESSEPEASPKPEETPKPEATPKPNKEGVDTSDHNNPGLWLFLFLVSIALTVALLKDRKGRKLGAFLLAAALASTALTKTDVKAEGEQEGLDMTGYSLVWEDNFDGAELNRDDWNVERHAPRWVNAELQAYIDSPETIYIEDGHLVLKPVKKGDEYFSGRVNTMGKHDFKYGYMEARAKVPTGKGYLPAFWMMPTEESRYGQWPRCGEIDIMEVMGQQTNLAYGTIHYGNPHAQNQGTFTTDGDFSKEYHTYGIEWLPGKLTWYIDGQKYYETSDWYTTTVGKGTVTYPAPFDQPFYIILNLAIGGSWVTYPDETTTYEDQEFDIDYVKVYQKDAYDENVTRPEKAPVELRKADEQGNYLLNGSFNKLEPWELVTGQGGEATSSIENNEITITTTNAGEQDYSVQLLQRAVPVEKGYTYVASFDAYADEERSGLVAIEGGEDSSWTRYLVDTKFTVGPEKKHYEFPFTMEEDSDATSVFEFNLGNTDPIAPIHISNVKLEKQKTIVDLLIPITVDGKEVQLHSQVSYIKTPVEAEPARTVLSDGNYVCNGEFQEGSDRKDYWESSAETSVTPIEDGRRLKVTVGETPVTVEQKDIPLTPNGKFDLSFDIEGEAGKDVRISIADFNFTAELAGGKQTMSSMKFATGETFGNTLSFVFTQPGVYYLDNVRLIEDSLIKNGSFDAGLAGFTSFADGAATATYIVDSQLETNAYDITIDDTGTEDWYIQLMQDDVNLKENSCYKLTLRMKSSLDRKISVAIQRNGALFDPADWTPYVQNIVDVVKDWTDYTFYFKQNPGTEPKSDPHARLSISMGAIGGDRITQQHRIFIDDIVLEEIDESQMPQEEIPSVEPGLNMIDNGDFENGEDKWEGFGNAIEPAVGTLSLVDGKAVVTLDNYGTEDWHAQLKHFGIVLEKGASYKVTFKGSSTAARDIKVNVMSNDGKFTWYGGSTIDLTEEEKPFEITFVMEKDTDANAGLYISMGKTDNPANSVITLDDFSLVKLPAE